MTFKTYEINVDLVHDTSTTCSNRFSQNDRNSAKLLVTITNKGAELDLSQAKSVRMSFKKPDGTRVFQNDCQPINAMKGKYQIVLKTQTLTSVGNVIAQIHIEEEDRIIDTQKFFFVVNDSLASDEAIESTNEFTIIQKAIEAGKKLEGVDINGIIAAGELAKGALPKSGGTMTGALNVNAPLFLKSKDGVKQYSFETDANGKLWFSDKNAPRDIFTVESDGTFRVAGLTNLLKNTGGTMTGDLQINSANKGFQVGNGTAQLIQSVDTLGRYYWYSSIGKTPLRYDIPNELLAFLSASSFSNTLTMAGANARLVIDEGGQSVTFDQPVAQTSARGLLYRENGVTLGGIGRIRSTTDAYNYIGWGANPWDMSSSLVVSDKALKYKGKDVAMRDKDDRATIPLTTDAELITSYGVIADRRGNTVTLRAPIRRKVGSTNGHVFTLPPGMRPTMMLTQVVHASDGTPALMTIPSDSGQVLLQTITPAIMGKDYHIVLTYVAD
ncbi:BppU family phage baseplate upper protein [Bacillus cereus group sp. TH160LC]|uniref:BppU family phage baseplate upper protein n=1 Tax=Bacillus cereus group sp. TH160LC TaxID=3018058 RepID=UPI0022E39E96|nr:BppU family phage baseplate upper protein [Bacillus cereus group sp. TH160LC]MDA1652645.1 BppU family phage baseplate upper protein [Bacillus cereus group sp. TH160LC]